MGEEQEEDIRDGYSSSFRSIHTTIVKDLITFKIYLTFVTVPFSKLDDILH